MEEKSFPTRCGTIRYWVGGGAEQAAPQLIFLPGLTADHRLFEKQLAYFEGKFPVLVWDAPGHAASWPFSLTFTLPDKVRWLEEILRQEVGVVFMQLLEHAGVFKRDAEGRAAFLRFAESV